MAPMGFAYCAPLGSERADRALVHLAGGNSAEVVFGRRTQWCRAVSSTEWREVAEILPPRRCAMAVCISPSMRPDQRKSLWHNVLRSAMNEVIDARWDRAGWGAKRLLRAR